LNSSGLKAPLNRYARLALHRLVSRAAPAAPLLSVAFVALAGVLLLAVPASAVTVTFERSFGCAEEPDDCAGDTTWSPRRLAVDEASGDVYVIDLGHDAVKRFSAGGEYLGQLFVPEAGGETFGFSAEDADIAVDNSGGVNQGTVYVASGVNAGPIFAFAPTGAFKWGELDYEEPCGIAVDNSGQVFVANWNEGLRRANVENGGAEGAPILAGTGSCHIAFDTSNNLLLNHWLGPVDRYDPPDYTAPSPIEEDTTLDVAVDSSSDEVYANLGNRIDISSPSGDEVGAFAPQAGNFWGIAVNGASGKIYVTNTDGPGGEIYVRQGAAPKPSARTGEANPIGPAAAILRGATNPNGVDTQCSFEYGTTTALGTTQPCAAAAGNDSAEVPVSAEIGGLAEETTYYYRLVTTSVNGTTKGAIAAFEFVPPLPLTVVLAGSGSGSVSSAPSGIDCGLVCSAEFEEGKDVTLTATPASGSTFAGWSGGGCSGTGPCQLALSAATSVTATFDLVSGVGGGGSGGGATGTQPPTSPRGAPAPPDQAAYGRCVAKAVRAFRKARKAAAHKRGKAEARAMKAAKKRKRAAIAACRASFVA
jgi:Divergent InlB B-repeat domain